MQGERWKQVEALFEEAQQRPTDQRAEFLRQACPGDPELRAEVESLLKAADSRDPLLDGSPLSSIAERAPALKPGDKLGNFEIVALIGRGGMGEVYRAHDLRLKRDVAIKTLPSGFSSDRDRVTRFEREARAASALNHPNIVSVHDIGMEGGVSFMVSELVDGETLARLILRGPLPLRKLVGVSTQICDGLAAAHAAGVIHRDLKPGNIMLTRDGRPKILDFGLARQDHPRGVDSTITDASQPGVIIGTPGYMSPEQVRGAPTDARSDIFSLGVILYEMACGKRAFSGTSSVEVMNSILKDEPPELQPDSPTALDRIVRRCIEKQPSRRFQSAADLGFALNAITISDVTAAKRGRQVPGKRAIAAGIAVLLATAAAAYFWTIRPMMPRVTHIVQITHDGESKHDLITDGARLYYTVDSFGVEVFQISASGGEPVKMPSLAGMYIDDISSDRSEFLLRHTTQSGGAPLWAAPVLGGAPRRLGDLAATGGAAWSPQGDRIIYSKGPEICVARSDGTESRALATVEGQTFRPRWSPDGRTIRFTVFAAEGGSLWDVSAFGGHPRAVFPEWTGHWEAGGGWTSDGKYFLFQGGTAGVADIWALREKIRLPGASRQPLRLTAGPLIALNPVPSLDGRRIFFIGRLNNGEFVRYDPKSAHWLPYLSGISATQLNYSHDGKWLTYVSFPGQALWRSDAEGGRRLQLTSLPLQVGSARWSPDEKQIAFDGSPPGKAQRVYILPVGGGAARQLTNGESGGGGDIDPSWSPDGGSLVFSGAPSSALDTSEKLLLRIVDVKSGRISILPGSKGLWSPHYSPKGRYIAALEFPGHHLILYDIEKQQRTDLSPSLTGDWPCWSRDGQFVYFEYNYLGGNGSTEIYRVRVRDRKLERLGNLQGVKFPQVVGEWFGLAPDDSLLSIRDTGGTDIYAIDWDAP